MYTDSIIRKLTGIITIKTTRVRICVLLVLAISAFLYIQSLIPHFSFWGDYFSRLGSITILYIFLAAFTCEYIDSSLGMGYGTTLTPVLLLFGFAPLQVVPCILLSEFVSGLAATLMHHRDGNVNFFKDKEAKSAALMLSLLSIVGTIIAVTLAVRVSKFWLNIIISIIVLMAGITTIATSGRKLRYRRVHMIILGAVAAFNKGLSGGGYGPLVTSGQVVSGLDAKKAVGITSFAESLTCLTGLTFYLLFRKSIDWKLALPLTVGALLSVPVATLTVKHIPEKVMRLAVGITTCLLGTLILVKLFI